MSIQSINVQKTKAAPSCIQLSLTYRQFALPPIGDGLLIGRKASIGSNSLFDALERMLPGLYELIKLDEHPDIEAVIILRSQYRFLGRKQLVELVIKHGEGLTDPTSCLQVELRGDVTMSIKVEKEK